MCVVALWHPRWTLLRASVCQLWWMLGLHGVASARGGTQKEVYAELGPMKNRRREEQKPAKNLSIAGRKNRPRLHKQQSPRINRQSGRRVEQREAGARCESARQQK